MKTDQIIRVAAIALLTIGCVVVLLPFFTAALLAMVICLSTWPLYAYLNALLGGNRNGAAGIMTLLLILLFVVPIAVLAMSLVENFPKLAEIVAAWIDRGPPAPPAWLKTMPWFGEWLDAYWHQVMESRDELVKLLQRGLEPTRVLLVGAGKAVGQGLLQMMIAVFIAFFFYRDGDRLVDALRRTLDRVAGPLSGEVLGIIEGTVRGVIFGILGTAFAQGVVAAIGFAIASVPAPIALGALVAAVSLIPGGPPFVWVGATIWLFTEDRIAWSIFMAIWGLVVISGIDNVVRPLLISRGSSMPLLLILLGVFGGLLGFGFVGLFIGPVLLAVGYTLLRKWAGLDVRLAAEGHRDGRCGRDGPARRRGSRATGPPDAARAARARRTRRPRAPRSRAAGRGRAWCPSAACPSGRGSRASRVRRAGRARRRAAVAARGRHRGRWRC